MKRILLAIQILLLSGFLSFAQEKNLREEVLDPVIHSCGSYMPYQFEPQVYSPVPKGYKPVYVSHFGRHGSRFHTSEDAFKSVLPVLTRANASGALTDEGKELYASVQRFLLISKGNFGELTQIGINEHKEIASRMFQSFPEVFRSRGRRAIRAVSSKVPRCVRSMNSFCEELKARNPRLEIEQFYGNDWQHMVAPNHQEYKDYLRNGSWKAIYEEYARKRIDPGCLISRIFADKSVFKSRRDERRFAENLFALATGRFAVPFEEDLQAFFTEDEIYALWETKNLKQYLSKGPSGIDGNVAISIAIPLLRDIIDRADIALAGNATAADLRFGHGEGIMPVTALMGIEGMSAETTDPQQVSRLWTDWKITSMASNIQLIFYSCKTGDVIVRVMVNEREVTFPVSSAGGPYYRWEDLKEFFLQRIRKVERTPRNAAEAILSHISAPVFRNADYNAGDYGVVADGTTDNSVSLDLLITRCSNEGGGRIILPEGTVLCNGPVSLKSNVNLCIPKGCELKFGKNPEYYLPGHMTVWEGTELFNYSSFLRADHCNNIAITGGGVVNGNASGGFASFRPQRSSQQNTLRQMGIDLVPVRERYFGERSILPPNMIEPFGCKNVLIEGITILDSPFWCIHPLFCDNVTVRGVTIDSYNRNNDGCDPEYTTNVLIEDCNFHTGDDAIAIKAGRDQDAWRIGQKTSGIVIRNCEFSSRWNGLCIGSEMAAGVENVVMYNVHVSSCASAIYFKSNLDRGGFIRNVWVDDIRCDTVSTAFIRFENNYHGGRGGNHPTLFSNFHISNVCGGVSNECGFYAVGIKGVPISNVYLENVTLESCKIPYTLINTKNVHFNNVRINGVLQEQDPKDTGIVRLSTD